jgi:hypothetical protein
MTFCSKQLLQKQPQQRLMVAMTQLKQLFLTQVSHNFSLPNYSI